MSPFDMKPRISNDIQLKRLSDRLNRFRFFSLSFILKKYFILLHISRIFLIDKTHSRHNAKGTIGPLSSFLPLSCFVFLCLPLSS